MDNTFVSLGFRNIVNRSRVIAVLYPESVSVKRLVTAARDAGQLVDASAGRKTKAVIVTDSGHCILCGLTPETIEMRLNLKDAEEVTE